MLGITNGGRFSTSLQDLSVTVCFKLSQAVEQQFGWVLGIKCLY